jgi:uncharacterized membrane protein YoaK (UPF0700 family)
MLTQRRFILRVAARITIGLIVICGIGWITDKVAMSWQARLAVDTIVIGIVGGVVTMRPITYRQYVDSARE